MTKVTMYQANDGSLHKKPAERDAKNIELRTAPLVEEFVNGLGAEDVGTVEGHPAIALEELPAFFVKHADALRTLLNRAVQPAGRPRKAKEGATPRKPRAKKADAQTNAGGSELKGALDTLNPPAATDADPVDDVLSGLNP